MHRKVTRTGPKTLTISLPAQWVKENNLLPGEEINLERREDELVISSLKRSVSSKKIKIPYKEYLIQDMLEKLYSESYSEIEIFSEEEMPKSLQRMIGTFPGFEAVDVQPKNILIKRLFVAVNQNVNSMLRRAFLLFMECLENNPPKPDKKIKELLWLLKKEVYEKDIVNSLLDFYVILERCSAPIYDEVYVQIRSIFSNLYKQYYGFDDLTARELSEIFTKKEEILRHHSNPSKKTIEIGKLYHVFEIFVVLNKIILNKKSLEELSKVTNKMDKKKFSVGLCLKNQSNEFWSIDVVEGMKDVADKLGDVELIFKYPLTDFDVSDQEKILKNFISEKVDAIIYAPIDSKALRDTLNKINSESIPLIVLDTDLNLSGIKYYYLGFDNYDGGYRTGQYLSNYLSKKSNILVLSGHLTGNFTKRVEGFKDAIGKNHIISVLKGEFIGSVAYEGVLSHIRKKEVDAIFATSDNMALGAISALKEAGIKIPVCGFDATTKGMNKLKSGNLISIVDTKPKKLGALGIQMTHDILFGKVVAERTTYDVELISKKL